MAINAPHVWAKDGLVYNTGYKKCEYTNNGLVVVSTNSQIVGGMYGLIQYECDNTIGHIVSKLECKKCGLYCSENEMIDGCEQLVTPMVTGALIGILAFILTAYIWKKWLFSACTSAWGKVVDCRHKRKFLRDERKVDKIVARLGRARTPSLTTVAIMLGLLTAALACDNTLYIGSKGVICDNTHCIESSMYDLTIETGSTLCFRDQKGDLITLSMTSSYRVVRSMLVYHTSDYDLSTEQLWECKGAGICWRGGCHQTSMHPSLKRAKKPGSIIKYGCDTDVIGCDNYCHYGVSCIYYRWQVDPIGPPIPVYKAVTKYWGLDLTVTYGNLTKVYQVNVNNPKFNLGAVDKTSFPMLVTGFNAQEDDNEKFYIIARGNIYNVDASRQNMPERDKLGDYQQDTRNLTTAMNTQDIKCTTHSCRTVCTMPEPKVRRFLNGNTHAESLQSKFIGSNSVLLTTQKVNGIAKLLIGNVEINSLRVIPAKCLFDVIGTFSCSGCSIKPYIILQATEIQEPGLVPFTSNCSFSGLSVGCSIEPVKLELDDLNHYCKIYFPSLNRSVNVEMKYNYLGQLDPTREIISRGINVDDIYSLTMNQTTWNSIGYSWLGLSLFSLLVSMIIRNATNIYKLILGCCICKKAKDINN